MPVDLELVQRAAGALERLLPVAPVTTSLASSESKAPADDVARRRRRRRRARPGRREAPARDGAGGGQEAAAGVLAVDPELEASGRAAAGRRSRSSSPSAMRNCSRTRSMPVTSSVTGCSTCSRVLTSRKEIVPSWPTRNSQVPGADVAGLADDRLGRAVELARCCVGEERRRGLLDELLVAALQRAVTGATPRPRCRACRPGTGSRRAAGGPGSARRSTRRGRTPRPPRGRRESYSSGISSQRAGDLQPAPAAAERRLDGDRQAVLARRTRPPRRRRRPGPGCRAPAARRPAGRCAGPATLSPSARMACGGGPIQVSPASMTACGEVGVLRQEAVAGVHRVRARLRRRRRAPWRCRGSVSAGVVAAQRVRLVGQRGRAARPGPGRRRPRRCRARRPGRRGPPGPRSRRGWR